MFVINPSVKQNLRIHLYDLLLIVGGYIYNFMSTQVEEGVEGIDANKAKFKDIRKACELQIFELICVCAWESVSKSGQSFKNGVKWGALVTHFDNILVNYPLKQWWRLSLMQHAVSSYRFLKFRMVFSKLLMKCVVRWLF